MKPVIVLIALAAIGYYAFHGQKDIWDSHQAVEAAHSEVVTSKAKADQRVKEVIAEKEEIEKQIGQLQQQITEAQAEVEKQKGLLARAEAAAAAQPKVVVEAPVIPSRPAPSQAQLEARQGELGKGYYFLVLRDGTVLKNVTVSKIGNGEMTFTSSSGPVRVTRDKLPADVVSKFGLNFDESPISTASSEQGGIVVRTQSGGSNSQSSQGSESTASPGEATPFGFTSNTLPPDKTQTGKSVNNVNDTRSLTGVLAEQVNDLKAKVSALKAKAADASDPAAAQRFRDEAAKIEQQIAVLQGG